MVIQIQLILKLYYIITNMFNRAIKKMINIKPKYTIKKMNINISENSAFSLYKKKNLII